MFGATSDTGEIYDAMARGVVTSTMEGIHGTVFAYGQTSSGKTHTMMGNNDCPGVIPRAVSDIFTYIRENHDREFLLRVSYLEIYQECIRDLFKPEDTDLKIHEHPEHGFYVKSTEVVVTSEEEILQLMDSGEAHRHVGQTNMNEKSSRSHTIFRITVESKLEIPDEDASPASDDEDEEESKAGICIRAASLNLVDLAGSERVGDTGAAGVRLKEAGNINKSLLTLGNVIKQLSEGKSNSAHIPYRDSKLTRILQPSLGGNGKTSMICAVTASSTHIDETRSTLLFANRAKNVKNSASINEVMDDKALLVQSKKQIADLQKQLMIMQRSGSGIAGYGVSSEDVENLLRQKQQVEEANQALAQKVLQDANEKEKLTSKLAHLMLGSKNPAPTVSRRASNPVLPMRRVTFGNYTHRAEGKHRISVLAAPNRPLQSLLETNCSSGDGSVHDDGGGAFSKIKTFSNFQPSAAWEEDDRDLGVLEEFEEMEEEEDTEDDDEKEDEVEQDVTMNSSAISTSSSTRRSGEYKDQQYIQNLEARLFESERKVSEMQASLGAIDVGTQDFVKLQNDYTALRDEADGKQREIEHFEKEYSRVVSESKALADQLDTKDRQLQEALSVEAEQGTNPRAAAINREVKLGVAPAAAREQDNQDLRTTIDQLERDRHELELQVKARHADFKLAQDSLTAMEAKFATSQQEMSELRHATEQSAVLAASQELQSNGLAAKYADNNTQLETQVAGLELQLATMRAEQLAAAAAMAQSRDESSKSRGRISQLQESINELRESNTVMKKELKASEIELKRETARNATDGRAADRDASKLLAVEAKLKSLLQEKNTLGAEKAAAQRETRQLKQRIEKVQGTLAKSDASSGAKKLRLELEDMRSKLEESERVQYELREQLEQAEQQCKDMVCTLETQEEELGLTQVELQAAETRAAASTQELEAIRTDQVADRAQLESSAVQISKLEASALEMSARVEELQQALVQKDTELKSAAGEKEKAESISAQLVAELETTVQTAESLKADVADKSLQLSAAQRELEQSFKADAKLQAAQQTVAQIETQLMNAQSEIAELRSKQEETARAKEDVQSKLDLAEAQLAAASTQAKSQEGELTNTLHLMQVNLDQCNHQLDMVTAERDELTSRVAEAESVATDAVVAVESKQDDLDKLHARCKQLLGSAPSNQQVVELQSQLSTEQDLRQQLSGQIAELEEEVDLLQDDKNRMADLMTVKDKMVSDERYQREALESKLRRICSRVKSQRDNLDPHTPLAFGGSAHQNR